MAAALDQGGQSEAAGPHAGKSAVGTPVRCAARERSRSGAETQPTDESFGAMLRRCRQQTGLSQNALARLVSIDASYIHRLESGERDAPTRQVIEALARALLLTMAESDCLLFAAGYVPPSLRQLGPNDSTIAAVTRILTDDRLSSAARADFRAVVETIAARWQNPSHAVAPCQTQPVSGHAREQSGAATPATGTR
jgi:transcriptional regulator with XRE-family HTH domain